VKGEKKKKKIIIIKKKKKNNNKTSRQFTTTRVIDSTTRVMIRHDEAHQDITHGKLLLNKRLDNVRGKATGND
jgi:hypothetical protein